MSSDINQPHEIWYVDDDPDDQYFVKKAIDVVDGEINCVSFLESERVINYIEQHGCTADCLLIDLNMPGLDGFELLQALRNNEQAALVPIIIFSTSAAEADVKKSYRLGANAFVTKPLDMQNVIEVVSYTVGFWLNIATITR